MAAQLITTNARVARRLKLWIARATNSLPDPVGPVINTVVSRRAMSRAPRYTGCIFHELPIIPARGACRIASTASTRVGMGAAIVAIVRDGIGEEISSATAASGP